MIPDHLIDKSARALIRGRGRDPGETGNLPELTGALHDAAVILEAVAADIWGEGYAACYARQLQADLWPYLDEDEQAEKEYAEACGRDAATRAPNPYRASETA